MVALAMHKNKFLCLWSVVQGEIRVHILLSVYPFGTPAALDSPIHLFSPGGISSSGMQVKLALLWASSSLNALKTLPWRFFDTLEIREAKSGVGTVLDPTPSPCLLSLPLMCEVFLSDAQTLNAIWVLCFVHMNF